VAAAGSNLNRLIVANVSLADQAAGLQWVALNLDLSVEQNARIYGVDFAANVIGADYNNLTFTQLIIFRNMNLDIALSNAQTALGEQLYQSWNEFLPQRVFHREWITPWRLEGPGRYAVFGQMLFSALAAPYQALLTVSGEIVSKSGDKGFPWDLR
jgi:hypothetical protein